MSKLMNEIKRAAVGDGKYAGLPSHVYSLFGDALAKLDEVAALEADNKEADRLLLAAAVKYKGLEQRVEHFERFKLFLKTVGGIDVDFAWSETAAEGGGMTEKTAAQAFRELHEAWMSLVSEVLHWFIRPLDWLNQRIDRKESDD